MSGCAGVISTCDDDHASDCDAFWNWSVSSGNATSTDDENDCVSGEETVNGNDENDSVSGSSADVAHGIYSWTYDDWS